jgi:hypothetical protein
LDKRGEIMTDVKVKRVLENEKERGDFLWYLSLEVRRGR